MFQLQDCTISNEKFETLSPKSKQQRSRGTIQGQDCTISKEKFETLSHKSKQQRPRPRGTHQRLTTRLYHIQGKVRNFKPYIYATRPKIQHLTPRFEQNCGFLDLSSLTQKLRKADHALRLLEFKIKDENYININEKESTFLILKFTGEFCFLEENRKSDRKISKFTLKIELNVRKREGERENLRGD